MHAPFSPSSISRVIACPASWREEQSYPDTTSPAAERGTLIHAGMEAVLKGTAMPTALTVEDAELAHRCGEVVMGLMHDLSLEENTVTLHTEVRLPVGKYLGLDDESLIWGTADIVIVTPTKLIILDLKTGQIPVNVTGSWQLIAYLLGAIEKYGRRPSYELGILQPPISMQPSWWIVNDPTRYAVKIDDAISDALSMNPHFRPGTDQCRWCRASGDCSYEARWATEQDFGVDPAKLSPEAMADLLLRKKAIVDFLNKVERRAVAAATAGVAFPGMKLVHKATRERWALSDPQKLAEAFEERQLPVELLMPPTPLSPAQARKAVSSKKVFEGLVTKPEGELTLAPSDDRRQEVAAEFDAE